MYNTLVHDWPPGKLRPQRGRQAGWQHHQNWNIWCSSAPSGAGNTRKISKGDCTRDKTCFFLSFYFLPFATLIFTSKFYLSRKLASVHSVLGALAIIRSPMEMELFEPVGACDGSIGQSCKKPKIKHLYLNIELHDAASETWLGTSFVEVTGMK